MKDSLSLLQLIKLQKSFQLYLIQLILYFKEAIFLQSLASSQGFRFSQYYLNNSHFFKVKFLIELKQLALKIFAERLA